MIRNIRKCASFTLAASGRLITEQGTCTSSRRPGYVINNGHFLSPRLRQRTRLPTQAFPDFWKDQLPQLMRSDEES